MLDLVRANQELRRGECSWTLKWSIMTEYAKKFDFFAPPKRDPFLSRRKKPEWGQRCFWSSCDGNRIVRQDLLGSSTSLYRCHSPCPLGRKSSHPSASLLWNRSPFTLLFLASSPSFSQYFFPTWPRSCPTYSLFSLGVLFPRFLSLVTDVTHIEWKGWTLA